MLKLLIIEDNVEQLKNITNIIASTFSQIKIYNISFDGESTLNLIKNYKVDIILLDLKLSGMSGVDIINFIEKENLYKYKNSIIVFSGETTLLKKVIHSHYLFSYILKGNGYNHLLNELKLLIKSKEDIINIQELNKKIDKELKYLNYNFSYSGTKYLRESIIEIYKIKENFDGNLSKNIYPIIGKRYHKNPNTIYCNIKKATNAMFFDCNEQILKKFLNTTYFVRPKVNEIIMIILNKIIK